MNILYSSFKYLINMKIFLIRHGETTGDIEGRYGGDYDDELTAKGVEQGKELALKLEDKGIEVIFHSPLIRARQTAGLVADKLQIPLKEIKDLRERNHYGILSGLTKEECLERFPDEVAKLKNDGVHSKVEGSEYYESFKERIISVFSEIIKEEQETVAIISHGGVIRGFMREIAVFGELSKLGDCGIIELDYKDVFELVSLDGVALE